MGIRRCCRLSTSRAFTLAELLVGFMIAACLGAILTAGYRWVVLSSSRTSRQLLARDRALRVVAFIEPRALHVGLGLSACSGSGALQRALGRGVSDAPQIAGWPDSFRGVRVYREGPIGLVPAAEKDGVFAGTAFCLLYALPSGMILRAEDGSADLKPGQRARFTVISAASGAPFRSGRFQDLRSWGVLPLTGLPVHVASLSGRQATLRPAPSAPLPLEAPSVAELYLLRCERFCVQNETLCFQGMEADWYPPNFYPREAGILALWAEWRPGLRCLDLWVLASGGSSAFGGGGRPVAWPEDAPWKAEFGRHELCVARASWRIENL